MMMVMMVNVMWNIIASLLFLVAVHRGAVTAVVAEPDGKQLSTFFYLMVVSSSLQSPLPTLSRELA